MSKRQVPNEASEAGSSKRARSDGVEGSSSLESDGDSKSGTRKRNNFKNDQLYMEEAAKLCADGLAKSEIIRRIEFNHKLVHLLLLHKSLSNRILTQDDHHTTQTWRNWMERPMRNHANKKRYDVICKMAKKINKRREAERMANRAKAVKGATNGKTIQFDFDSDSIETTPRPQRNKSQRKVSPSIRTARFEDDEEPLLEAPNEDLLGAPDDELDELEQITKPT